MVEVIEHLDAEEEVEAVVWIILGGYKPRILVITTPNKDFKCEHQETKI